MLEVVKRKLRKLVTSGLVTERYSDLTLEKIARPLAKWYAEEGMWASMVSKMSLDDFYDDLLVFFQTLQ